MGGPEMHGSDSSGSDDTMSQTDTDSLTSQIQITTNQQDLDKILKLIDIIKEKSCEPDLHNIILNYLTTSEPYGVFRGETSKDNIKNYFTDLKTIFQSSQDKIVTDVIESGNIKIFFDQLSLLVLKAIYTQPDDANELSLLELSLLSDCLKKEQPHPSCQVMLLSPSKRMSL